MAGAQASIKGRVEVPIYVVKVRRGVVTFRDSSGKEHRLKSGGTLNLNIDLLFTAGS